MNSLQLNMLLAISITLLASCSPSPKNAEEATISEMVGTDDVVEEKEIIPEMVKTDDVVEDEDTVLGDTLQFVEFMLGDAPYYVFKDEEGTQHTFIRNESKKYEFARELSDSEVNTDNQGWGSNTELIGKWFLISHVEKQEELYIDGPMGTVSVISDIEILTDIGFAGSNSQGIRVSDVVKILLTTNYEEDKFDSTLKDMPWTALANGADGELRTFPVSLELKPVHNPMVDAEGEMSDLKISMAGYKYDPMLLISGIEFPEGHQIDGVWLPKKQLMPGDSMEVGNYLIRAIGNVSDDATRQISDYKLIISGEKSGGQIEQTFLEQEYFDDAMIQFVWAGDIDADGIPDLYMDISYKYSFSNPALYLSSRAAGSEILRLESELRVY